MTQKNSTIISATMSIKFITTGLAMFGSEPLYYSIERVKEQILDPSEIDGVDVNGTFVSKTNPNAEIPSNILTIAHTAYLNYVQWYEQHKRVDIFDNYGNIIGHSSNGTEVYYDLE